MNIKQKIIAGMLVCGGQACIAQVITPEVFASAGDTYSNTQGSLSWTAGESVTETESSSNYYLTQGFQQPTSIVVTAINNPTTKTTVSIYPNPVSSSISVQRDGNEQLQIQLMDMNGKVILNKALSSSENQLDLSVFANGMYLLKVSNMDNELLQSLKIEKIK